jgi:hypothetical protein
MLPEDLKVLEDQFDAAEQEARTVVNGLDEELGVWRASDASWTVAQCFDHLAITNLVYLRAMEESALSGRAERKWRTGPARPGFMGGWFIHSMEPPVKSLFRLKTPRRIRPTETPALREAFTRFIESQDKVRIFLHEYADLDLRRVRFSNPFIRGVRFSLASGLHILSAHERRHLWQARGVRGAAELNDKRQVRQV